VADFSSVCWQGAGKTHVRGAIRQFSFYQRRSSVSVRNDSYFSAHPPPALYVVHAKTESGLRAINSVLTGFLRPFTCGFRRNISFHVYRHHGLNHASKNPTSQSKNLTTKTQTKAVIRISIFLAAHIHYRSFGPRPRLGGNFMPYYLTC
jgi:hypothetical protein